MLEKYKILLKLNLLTNSPFYKKYKILILPSISVLLCFLILFFITLPQYSTLKSTYSKVDEIKQLNAKLADKTLTLQKINSDDYKNNLDSSFIALPLEADIPGIIGQVLFLLSSSGLKLETISFGGGGTAENGVSEYQTRLEISGTQTGLLLFIDKVNAAPRIMKISRLEVSSAGTSSVDRINSSLTVTSYYQTLPPPTLKADQPVDLFNQKDQDTISKIKFSFETVSGVKYSTSSANSAIGKEDPFK